MTEVTISIPKRLEDNFIGHLSAQLPVDGLPSHVIFDFSALTFIRTCGIAYLGNLFEWLIENGVKVEIENYERDIPCIRFLNDSGFFERYINKPLFESARLRDTTFPFRPIGHAQVHHSIEAEFIPWLSDRMGHSAAELSTLKQVLSELFNNVQDHTVFDIGSLFAQHHPREDHVLIAVSDSGCGIPSNVKSHLPNLSDGEAIVKATELYFTTGSSRNRGVGLHQLLQQVVEANGGKVVIRSAGGSVRFSNENGHIRHTVLGFHGSCIGTMVEMSLPTNHNEWLGGDSGEEEALEW